MPSPSFRMPLFFGKDVLKEFKKVKFSTGYLGTIEDQGNNLTFGITPKGHVSIWLGDFDGLTDSMKDKFVSHYIEADRLGLHFVRTQVEGEFVKKDDPNEM